MKSGDCCICRYSPGDEPEDDLHARHYGIIERLGSKQASIQLSDGSEIRRAFGNIAVYLKLPVNWQELYQRQRVVRKKEAVKEGGKESAGETA